MQPADLWIRGIEPVQLLILLAVLLFVGIGVQRMLTAMGRRITTFWQVVLAWSACWGFLTFILYPPLPFHLLATYLGLITVALFVYAGATESGWQECRDTVLGMLSGRTRVHRFARVGVFVVLPVLTYAGLHDQMIPQFEAPIEFRSYGVPPRIFTVHGVPYITGNGETWIGKEEAQPTREQAAAGVTVHIPEHLVGLADGYAHVRIMGYLRNLDDVFSAVESTFPRLHVHGQLHRAPWDEGPDPYVNYFIVDKNGGFVGTEAYAVGGRFKCCTANWRTVTPPGSNVYILPQGYAFNDEPVDPGVPLRSSPSGRRNAPLADINLRTSL